MRAGKRRGHKLAISPRRLALTADGHELARCAARIADDLELSAELIDFLSPLGSVRSASRGSRPESSSGGRTPKDAAHVDGSDASVGPITSFRIGE